MMNDEQNLLEKQIEEEGQLAIELGDKIVASPRKLKQDVANMKDEYTRLTADSRTLTLQVTDLQAQDAIITQASSV